MTRIVLGRVTGPFGVKGWLKLESFTEPPALILEFARWRTSLPGGASGELKPLEGKRHGKGLVARVDGIGDRNAAIALGKPELWVDRTELPPPGAGEVYRADLVGLEVVNLAGESLGRVDRFLDFPANPVMVVVGERERWLPVGRGQKLRVDRAGGRITVDWDSEF